MCYANSSLQILYHCEPFRTQILSLKLDPNQQHILYELQDLFKQIGSQKKSSGAFNHKRFVAALKKNNVVFDNDEH